MLTPTWVLNPRSYSAIHLKFSVFLTTYRYRNLSSARYGAFMNQTSLHAFDIFYYCIGGLTYSSYQKHSITAVLLPLT